MQTGSFGQPCVSGHSALIYDRGGKRRKNALVDITSVKWGRTLSGQSTSEITIAGKQACKAQLAVLLSIQSKRDELVVFRGTTRVFEGVILRVKWYSNRVVVLAQDSPTTYLAGTALSKAWPGPDNGGAPLMTDRIEGIITYELTTSYDMRIGTGMAAQVVTVPRWEAIATPANILPYLEVRPSSTLLTRSDTLGFEMTVFEHLDNLARNTLNYTVIGRKLLIWDSDQLLGKTRKLTDADFYGEIEVVQDGTDFSNINHVSATRDEDAGAQDPGVTQGVGHDGGVDSYYGVWEYISTLESEDGSDDPTEDELNSQAQRVDRARNTMPLVMNIPSSSGLRLSNDLTINQLVPGVVMPVSATFNLKEVTQDQLLSSLQVQETPNNELIQVTLVPAGQLTVIP